MTVAGEKSDPRARRPTGAGQATAQTSPAKASLSEHAREIIALLLLGIAAFILVALYGGDAAGAAGRGVRTGLVYVFGRLAFLIPLALVAVAATTVVQLRFWRTYRFAGVLTFLFGVFLLVASEAPPFGSHGEEEFVRGDFETKGGGLGEALYALFHRVMGMVGVGIVGWLAVVIGLIVVTGITAVWLGQRTKRAATAVKRPVERSALATRRREDDLDVATGGVECSPGPRKPAGWSSEDYRIGRPPVRLGPVDLVDAASADAQGPVRNAGRGGVFGDAFEEWAHGHSASEGPLLPSGDVVNGKARTVVDGADAFADMYDAREGEAMRAGKGTAADAAGGPAVGSAGEPPGVGGGSCGSEDETSESAVLGRGRGDGETAAEDNQEPIPGLGRVSRQIELAVSGPTYLLPEAAMLRKSAPATGGRGESERDAGSVLLQALSQFGVEARIIGMVVGPRVTRYELQLAPGTKVAKVSALRDDLAYALASTEIRILTPIPGKSAVGVEVPNQRPDFVTLGDIYREFPKSAGPLMVWLGKDISGKAVYADLTKLPHLLVAGTTGSGKSGCLNCLVSSVLLRSTPEQVRLIMIDPKKVELSHYDRIPHLLVPVVTNMKDAAGVLHNVVKEMEDRYELLELDHARSLAEANKTRARRGESPLPYILIVIEELGDLMITSPQEVEDYVIRLAQKSRAVGIHLVVATQRPSADVITGMIKANIPSRIAFAVSSQTDSRVILDANGAETLLGMGDMLFKPLGSSHLQRVQGAYITEEEIASLVNHWRHQGEPKFREELLRRPVEAKKGDESLFDPDSDELLADAARLVVDTGSASVSMLQRRLRVGYTRAGRLIDMLERRGIVGPWEGSKPRPILIGVEEFEHVLSGLKPEK